MVANFERVVVKSTTGTSHERRAKVVSVDRHTQNKVVARMRGRMDSKPHTIAINVPCRRKKKKKKERIIKSVICILL